MDNTIPTIEINLDEKCKRCHKPGVTQNGLCLRCINKALKKGEFDNILERVRKENQK